MIRRHFYELRGRDTEEINGQKILKNHNKIKRITNIEKSLTILENSGIITYVLETRANQSKR